MESIIGYQIYLPSFCDGNKDGIGDFKGVISKITYLKKLGINTIWLSPLNKSPMLDNGYDISDYYQVNSLYGSFDEFKELISICHQNGIRVIMDLVLNHCSNQHEWFKKAVADPNSKYHDFFIFRKKKNNWGSFFSSSAWTYLEELDEYYFHTFGNYMPDLNWENDEVKSEMIKIANFYLDLGIDGFRLDAISHLAKDLSFKDSDLEVNQEGWVCDPSKFSNLEGLFDYLKLLNREVFNKRPCITIGEVGGSCDYQTLNKFLTYLDFAFTFDHNWHNGFSLNNLKQNLDLVSLKQVFNNNYLNSVKNKNKLISYWLNHDHPRLLQHYGNLRYPKLSAVCLASFLALFKGSIFIYNGEEIGMVNLDYENLEAYQDVSAKKFIEENQNKLSKEIIIKYLQNTNRCNARSKMMWDQTNSSNKAFISHNVLDEEKDPTSILNSYRKLLAYRTENLNFFNTSDFEFLNLKSKKSMSYIRKSNNKVVVNLINLSEDNIEYDFDIDLNNYKIVFSNYHKQAKNLRPYENIVLEGEINEN